jgi:hypothetical protein
MHVGTVCAGVFEILDATPDTLFEKLRLSQALKSLVVEGPFL